MRAKFAILLSNLNVLAFARDRHDHALSVLRWLALLVPMAAAVGSLCAAFLCLHPVPPDRPRRVPVLAAGSLQACGAGAGERRASADEQ